MPAVAKTNHPAFLELFHTPREFAIYNPCDDAVELQYDGEYKRVPARDEVVEPDPKSPHRCHSCLDVDGNLIPGTLILKDIPGPRGMCDGRGTDYWSAAAAIKETLGLDPTTGAGHGPYYDRGLSFISTRPTPDELEKVLGEADVRHESWLINWASQVKEEVQARAAKHRSLGLNFVMSPKEHLELAKADAVLEAADQKYRQAAMAKVGLAVPQEDDELDLFVKERAESMAAKERSSDLEKQKLAEALASDPEFKRLLKKQWWDKKKAKTAVSP